MLDGEGSGKPLQYSCLENPMDRGAWLAIVHVLGFHRRGRPAAWLTRSDMRPLRADPRLPEAVGRAGRAALRAHSPRGRPSPAAVPFSRGRFLLQPLPLVIPTQRLQLTFLCCSQSSSLPSARDLTLGVGDGQGGLVCCDSWGRKESDMTERLHFHFHQ